MFVERPRGWDLLANVDDQIRIQEDLYELMKPTVKFNRTLP